VTEVYWYGVDVSHERSPIDAAIGRFTQVFGRPPSVVLVPADRVTIRTDVVVRVAGAGEPHGRHALYYAGPVPERGTLRIRR
jgi:hypothetical protein